MNEFDIETLNLALAEQGIISSEEYIMRLKILFPEMSEDKINRLHTIKKEIVDMAEDIVFKHYYKEKQSAEDVKLLLKDNFQWINDANLALLFNMVLYSLRGCLNFS